jgi:hypothetical protein
MSGLLGFSGESEGVCFPRLVLGRGALRLNATVSQAAHRREVRSAASSVVGATRAFLDVVQLIERSVFWVKDAVRTPSGHGERYLAYQVATVELQEKISNFEFLVDIDMLSKAARTITFHVLLTDLAISGPVTASWHC